MPKLEERATLLQARQNLQNLHFAQLAILGCILQNLCRGHGAHVVSLGLVEQNWGAFLSTPRQSPEPLQVEGKKGIEEYYSFIWLRRDMSRFAFSSLASDVP